MGRRSQSRSRGREKAKKSSKRKPPSPKEEDDSSGEMPAWAREESGDEGQMPLEARVALLEVENETLKAENRALKKKLVEALKRQSSGVGKDAKKEESKGSRGSAAEAGKATPPKADPVADDPAERRRKRLAEASPPREARQRHREASPVKQAPPEEEGKNAVLLSNDQMEAYNEPIPNNIPPEQRLPMVKEKLERFLANYDDKVQIIDLKSDKVIIKDRKTFSMRYSCVFRESGSKLKGTCHKRFYYDAMSRPTYVLDFETHESLVTAQPGTRPDGSLGVRDPRTEHLAVLYEEKGGKLTRMWIRPDSDKVGLDPTAGEDTLERMDIVKQFENKINELRGNPPGSKCGPRIFQNYHDVPTIG